MRAYLILSGLLATLSYVGQLSTSDGPIAAVLALVGLTLSLGYLYIGVRFKVLIISAPAQVLGIMKIGGAFLVLIAALAASSGAGIASVPGVGAGLLITWYLFVNARRLAAETRPPSDGAGTVVDSSIS